MLIDLPTTAWYRADDAPLPVVPAAGSALAAQTRSRDAATARALRAYLSTRPATTVRTTVDVEL